MEVTFKYSIITTDLRPNNKHKLEICGDEPSDLNPRPLKRRRESEHEVEAIVEEEKEEEEEEEQQPSSEEVEQNVMALARLTTCFEELKGKTGGMADLLMRNDLQECLPMIQILTAQIEAIKNRIYEKKAFYSLWMDSSRPLKLNLGYYGLLPVELIYVVFSFLDGKELMILGQVCSLFYEIAQDESLWKGLAERLWPTSIALGQKPENRSWKWLYKAKTRTFRQEEIRNGVGRFVLPYGNLYEGEWRNNKRHGQGTGIMKDGRRYDGQWENDMRSGFGIFRWPLDCGANGGDTYVGEWKDSKRHGQGVYTWVDGTKYDGQWGDGKREGMGCVVWPDGRKYVGEYKDGKMEGKGTFTWPDQSVYVGDYVNGKRHGNGKYTYSNGGIYEGEWEGGMRHGKGTLWKSTGEKYEGQWKWNAPYGLGTVTYKDGRQVEKQWIEDELLISP